MNWSDVKKAHLIKSYKETTVTGNIQQFPLRPSHNSERNFMSLNLQNKETLIPAECIGDFKKAMKIGYYKMMKQRGIITQAELEILLKMQTEKESA